MEPSQNAYKYGLLFGNEPVSQSEKARVIEEIQKVGGSLTFKIETSPEGWVGQCNEIPSIITGSTNHDPSDIEIKSEIQSAIFAAFDIKIEDRKIEAPFQEFKYSLARG